ncbi:hypothetical protein FRZ44_49670 [Hypericibacter terrae]|uniref:Uncharacterized protein n=1 Tax=Hypericibacter terrae TaxID=2602015 RepID=A0A5J6MPU1_9PROT|nr:hypothetical protein FRZ44_49670 [Hypericibacter terrae]
MRPVEIGAGERTDAFAAEAVADAVQRGVGAPVHPDESRVKKVTLGVHRYAAIELSGNAKGRDVAGLAPHSSQRVSNGGPESILPEPRILFGPAGPREGDRITPSSAAEQGQTFIEQHRLEALAAEIDAEQKSHGR